MSALRWAIKSSPGLAAELTRITPLFQQRIHTIPAVATRLGTLAELTSHAAGIGITLIPGTKPEH